VTPDPPADARLEAGAVGAEEPATGPPAPRRRVAVNTLIFSVATGLSRIAGLIREVVASSYFGTSGAFSAFTIAFQVPNLIRSLFADAAISAAFVPVFTDLLVQNKRKEAFRLASTLFFVILLVLGAITAFFVLTAGVVMPLFTGDQFSSQLDTLTAGLAQVLFPIVVLLGLNGLVVGILNAYDHFTIPAIAPLVWNIVIIVVLIVLKPAFHGQNQLYAYAIGVLIGTVVQFAMCLPVLGRLGFKLQIAFDWRDPKVLAVFKLMLPVTVGLGIINFDLLINSTLGSLVSDQAPRAIDAAFRIYMLPQGMFSVALATVLFPALSRFASRHDLRNLGATAANGMRQIFLLLVPAAAITIALATPITRLVYQRGSFDAESTQQVSEALFWFSFSLPFSGVNLLLTRTFFSMQTPWMPTALAAASLVVNAAVSLLLYKPLGISGLVIGTAVASLFMTIGQAIVLRRQVPSLEVVETFDTFLVMVGAAAILGCIAWIVWYLLDSLLGRSLPAQIVSVGSGITIGSLVYGYLMIHLRIHEAEQIQQLVMSRLKR
jgi:putative peptidoglycan lipid II flippase